MSEHRLITGLLVAVLALGGASAATAQTAGKPRASVLHGTTGPPGVQAATPSPPPPPPPPPATDYVVYFSFDQSAVTTEARAVVVKAAQAAAVSGAKSAIVGYNDTSGSATYNTALSERRAKATADALVSQGVPRASIAVSWKGEADPAVQTGDAVKELLNRRATIHVEF